MLIIREGGYSLNPTCPPGLRRGQIQSAPRVGSSRQKGFFQDTRTPLKMKVSGSHQEDNQGRDEVNTHFELEAVPLRL